MPAIQHISVTERSLKVAFQQKLKCGFFSCGYENNAGCESLEIRDWTEEVDDVSRAIDSSGDEEILDFEREEE